MRKLSRAWQERSEVKRSTRKRICRACSDHPNLPTASVALLRLAWSTQEAELALAHLSVQADEAHEASVAERMRADKEALRRRDLESACAAIARASAFAGAFGWQGWQRSRVRRRLQSSCEDCKMRPSPSACVRTKRRCGGAISRVRAR